MQSKQYTFSLDDLSEAGRIFQGVSPSKDGTVLTANEEMPPGVPLTIATERMEEFSPGLDTDLLTLLQATAEMELASTKLSYGPVLASSPAPKPGVQTGSKAASRSSSKTTGKTTGKAGRKSRQ